MGAQAVSVWDKIATLVPTRDAAVAVSGGDHYEPAIKIEPGRIHSDVPPPYRAPTGNELAFGLEDLRGRRIGRLTVLGLGPRAREGARWICRCDCGRYGGFLGRSLRRTEHPDLMMCVECNHTRMLRHRASVARAPIASASQQARLEQFARSGGLNDRT